MARGTQGYYEHLDSDENRLPSGMQRVGYDADTQTYTFRDTDGSYWESEEGNRYGNLHRVGQAQQEPLLVQPSSTSSATFTRARHSDIRYLAPFFVVVAVVLLLVFRFLNSYSEGGTRLECVEGWEKYQVEKGDTCWEIAKRRGMEVDELKEANQGLDCVTLAVGKEICVRI